MSGIDVGQLSEAINDKMDRDAYNADNDAFANLTQVVNVDYVVEWQLPTAENNYTWYRLYKSGWVEQGGRASAIGSEQTVGVVFPVEMADTNYFANSSTMGFGTSYADQQANTFELTVFNLSTTGFDVRIAGGITNRQIRSWCVAGMAAEES